MKKLNRFYLVFAIIYIVSNTCSSQAVNFYKWEQLVNENGISCTNSGYFGILTSDYNRKVRNEIFDARHRTDALHKFFELEKSDKSNNISVISFINCEYNLSSIHTFIFDHRTQALTKEFSVESYNFEEDEVHLNIVDTITSYLQDDLIHEAISQKTFRRCIVKSYIEYLYDEFIQFKEETDDVFLADKYSILEITEGILHYTNTENYNFIKSLKYILRSKEKVRFQNKIQKYNRIYPHLWNIIRAIQLWEEYREHSKPSDKIDKESKLKLRADRILLTDIPFSLKEEKLFEEALQRGVDLHDIGRTIGRAIKYTLACENLGIKDINDTKKQLSVYLDILENEEINSILYNTRANRVGNAIVCKDIKHEAFGASITILRTFDTDYTRLIREGKVELEEGNCKTAISKFRKANKLVGGLSSYSMLKISECEILLEQDSLSRIPTIVSGVDQNFNNLDTHRDLSMDFKISYSDNSIFVNVSKNKNGDYNSMFNERNYNIGDYRSLRDHNIEDDILLFVDWLAENQKNRIDTIRITYIGSSDASPFSSSRPLRLHNKKYKQDLYSYVCENSLYNLKGNKYSEGGKYGRIKKECFSFLELYKVRAKRKVEFTDKSFDKEERKEIFTRRNKYFKVDPSYQKNLTLAYLRARMKKDVVSSGLLGRNEFVITHSILAEVNDKKGYEYRHVDVSIELQYKK